MIHILLVEDSEDDTLLILSHLRSDGLDFTYERVETAEATAVALAERPPHAVLSDYGLPAFSAEGALNLVHAAGLDVPFILVSGTIGEETAAELMLAGAHDVVLKDRLRRLVPALRRSLRDAAARQQYRDADVAMRASEERFRLFAEHSQDVIFRYRPPPDAAIEYLSPAVEAVTGHRPEAFHGDPELLFALIDPADRALMRASWQSAEPAPLVVRWNRADGGTAWTEQRARTVLDRHGAVVAVEGALRDVTEHKLAEQRRLQLEGQLRQAERMESLGQLAGGIAHDFNNLLAVISGYADLIGSALPDGDPVQADLAGVRSAVDHGAGLVRQLLVLGRPDTSKAEVIDVNVVVADTEKLLRRTIGGDVALVVRPGPGLWPVVVERGRLEQVLVNLIVNARDAMPDGGHVTICTSNIAAPFDEPAGGPPPGHHVLISVTDTGTGMDSEVARRAFEPFFTTKGPLAGTGLGLATVYGAVTGAGGHVRLRSSPGEGATFDIYLPAAGTFRSGQ